MNTNTKATATATATAILGAILSAVLVLVAGMPALRAQTAVAEIISVTTAPSGSCPLEGQTVVVSNTGASSGQHWCCESGTWTACDTGTVGPTGPTGPTGTGDVVGPASATDNAVARFDGTTGKLIQNSAVVIADGGLSMTVNVGGIDRDFDLIVDLSTDERFKWDETNDRFFLSDDLRIDTGGTTTEFTIPIHPTTGQGLLRGITIPTRRFDIGTAGSDPYPFYLVAEGLDYAHTDVIGDKFVLDQEFTAASGGTFAGDLRMNDKLIVETATLANSATPSVVGAVAFLTGGTTTITNFSSPSTTQIIVVKSNHTVRVEHDATKISLTGATFFDMTSGDTLTLIHIGGVWYEMGRSDV